MWVLDARKNAEKIAYPVVWETQKDASNVIDYDIREEQTKDISAEINANNQTTTGMANVIPWVNAPKLIEGTSIISKKEIWYISATLNFTSQSITSSWNYPFTPTSITDEVWEYHFTKEWEFVYIPVDWAYHLQITRPASVYSSSHTHRWDTTITSRDWTVAQDSWPHSTWRNTSEVDVLLKKWNWLHIEWFCSWGSSLYPVVWWVVIKIARVWWL